MASNHLLCFFLLSLISCKNTAQERTTNDQRYQQEALQFLNVVYGAELSSQTLLLDDQPHFKHAESVLQNGYFSRTEYLQIRKQIERPHITTWRGFFRQKVRYIARDSVNMAFRDLHSFDFWTYVIPNIDSGVRAISAPIFLRNYSYCVFSSATTYVRMKERGEISLYRKVGRKWVIFRKIYSWNEE